MIMFVVAVFLIMTISFYVIHKEHKVIINPSHEHPLIVNKFTKSNLLMINQIHQNHFMGHKQNNIHPPPLQLGLPYQIDHDTHTQFHTNFWKNAKQLIPLPGLSNDNKIYVMNIIYNSKAREIDIFLLNKIYFDPNRGLHSWPNTKIKDIPQRYKDIRKTLIDDVKQLTPSLKCVFATEGSLITYVISPVCNAYIYIVIL